MRKVIGNLSVPIPFYEPSLAWAERPDLVVSGIPNGFAIYCLNEKTPRGFVFGLDRVECWDDTSTPREPRQELPYTATSDKIYWQSEDGSQVYVLNKNTLSLSYVELGNRSQIQCELLPIFELWKKLIHSRNKRALLKARAERSDGSKGKVDGF